MKNYHKQLLIFLPILNLICGVTIDLYAPALSKIEYAYSISQSIAQNTITITILGFAIGQFIFGVLSDHFGRRTTIVTALILYILSSLEIIFFKSVYLLLIGRALQGVACGSFAVNSRAIAVDNFTGHDLKVAITYLSLAWGIGPIIAPYIGGVLVTHFYWQTTLYVLFTYAVILFVFSLIIIKGHNKPRYSLNNYLSSMKEMLIDKEFIFRTVILGFCYVQGIIFNLTAPFWVTNVFHESPAIFGQAALILGIGYFSGTLLNRALLKKLSEQSLVIFGLILGVGFSSIFLFITHFSSVFQVALLIAMVNLGAGFIFANVMAGNLARYAKFAGICTALQGSLMLVIGSVISFLISIINNPTIHVIGLTYIGITILQLIFYIKLRLFKKSANLVA